MHPIIFATVCMLCSGPKSTTTIDTNSIVRVTASLTQYRLEKDGDIHLILSDSECTLITELPPGSVWGTSLHATSQWKKSGKRYTVSGTLFFDHEHNQAGAAPNGAVILPVLALWEGSHQ